MPRLSRCVVAGALTTLLCVSVAPNANLQTLPGPTASQAAATTRPLRMLVLGDSVMWGQGLKDENKFSFVLRNWLCERRGGGSCRNKKDVQLHVEAHSGAIIKRPEKGKDREREEKRFTRSVAPIRYYGEVNNALPTVWGQLELARHHYAENSIPLSEVDLVLVNGGINDLNASTLLVHKLIGGDVAERVDKYFADMKEFLKEVADTFPNARIVVPGYFPLVSEKTQKEVLSATIKDWLSALKDKKKDEKEVVEEAIKEEKRHDRSDESGGRKKDEPDLILSMLARRSREFVKESNRAFGEAVDELNRSHPPLPAAPVASGPQHPEATTRALFVEVPFNPENAYGTREGSYLWRVGGRGPTVVLKCADDNFLTKLVVNDEMQEDRPCMCDHASRGDNPVCFRAGAFHPNREGAIAYFEAIRRRLEPLLGSTGWLAKD